MKTKISDYGPVTPILPIASDFEAPRFEATVKDKTNIKILSWSRNFPKTLMGVSRYVCHHDTK